MSEYTLVIAPAAKKDLKEIYQYGLRQWGQAKSEHYLETIKDQLWSLTEHPFIGIDRPELRSDTRSLPIQSHTIFYRISTAKVEIIRILHGRQDPFRHLIRSSQL